MKETPEYKRLVDENVEKVARLIDKGKDKQLKKTESDEIEFSRAIKALSGLRVD